MRKQSVSLPTKQLAYDPHEKPDRYQDPAEGPGIIARMKEAVMSQSQRTRWVKTLAIVFAVVCLFMWLSPRGTDVYRGGL
jgi:guanosine-diphosphatase